MNSEIEKLRAKEAQIKKRIAQIQSRQKSTDRKQRTARLIRWGVVVEAMLKAKKIEPADWVEACREALSARDFSIATAEICSSLANEAHFSVLVTPKQCAPAASENQ